MGRNWAIAIGINQYDNLQPLNYAKRDAEAVCDFFHNELSFEKVYYFSDDSPPIASDSGPPLRSQPTYGVLSRFFRVRFESPFLHPGDNLWFFFAGHGKRYRNQDYLMPLDADPGNIERTAIPLNNITDRLRRCGADNVILLLDACRNEGDRDGEGIGIDQQQGVITLFSCSPNERSYEIDELQQGAFTHTLLQGLRVQGESNCATVERLDQYLCYQVPELNRRYKKPRQTPYTNAEPIAKRHLILLPQKATLADVTSLKNDALEFEAEGELELAEQLWIRVLAVSPADQQAIKAIKRLAVRSSNFRQPESQYDSSQPWSKQENITDVQSRLIQQQHEYEMLKEQLELKRIDADLLKTRQEFEFQSQLIDAELSGYLKAYQGETPRSKRTQKVPPQAPPLQAFKFDVITVNAEGIEVERRQSQAQYFIEKLSKDVSLEMILIPGGNFQMGASTFQGDQGEQPQHLVTIQPFFMSKYPITQAQWGIVSKWHKISRDILADPSTFKGAKRPVEQVLWHDAVEFCERLFRKTERQYTLPTEAQWEYACRAKTITHFHFGETITTELSNYNGNYTFVSAPQGLYREQTTDVDTFPPNAFGLYDMHGNVWEWCLDHWHDNYQGAPTGGNAWVEGGDSNLRVLRGGSWYFDPWYCRSAHRFGADSRDRSSGIGFRVVLPC